jgi:hypothetical protein
MINEQINKYNDNLIESKTIITMNDYIKNIYKLKYNSDLNIFDEFGFNNIDSYIIYSTKYNLIKSNNNKYINYYLLLELCIKYYNDYQVKLNKRYNICIKNKKIITMYYNLNIIDKCNDYLLEHNYYIIDYIKKINKLKYNVNIKFMDIFIKLIDIYDSNKHKTYLIKSYNTKIYAEYYIFLEKSINHFNDYQKQFNKKYNIYINEKKLDNINNFIL